MEVESSYAMDGVKIGLTVIFIILNGFFVAAEFAIVKISKSKLKVMINEKRPFATTAMWLFKRQNLALSACQLGITMASLALGWIGEPAIAHLITPLIHDLGINSQNVVHGIAFTIAFTIITAFHIIIGEQVPKIYAIRKPAIVFLSFSLLLKGFYVILYPFMYVLNAVTNVFLKWLGIEESDEHDTPLTEEEIRASLSIAHAKGELSKNEHKLLNAVFRFDDEVARQIMMPRNEVEFMDANKSFAENLIYAKNSKHTRFPLCDGSLDKVIGVIHIKDTIGYDHEDQLDLSSLARPAMLVPENILIGRLLQEFRVAKQHFAFVQDEHGTVLGIVTMEDVLEELVGNLQDEFDLEEPDIVEQKDGKFLVDGDIPVEDLNTRFDINLETEDANTLSGLIVEKFGHRLEKGKKMKLGHGVEAEIIATEGIRATKVNLTIPVVKDEETI
ncbi:hemolysin family protein [Reichenbachiella sp. MALMAid0571]|uniref:hemolysin family protein n=1 Tax=Reichenbachiella sp. MALMAid0571 TaxID=3143939 RepID=UPI0032DFF5CD